MEKKSAIKLGGITASEEELNSLFKETLDGIRDDIRESQENADIYLSAMADTGGKELYGQLYNDSLKIKALARTRQLTFLNMFKDRVGKKELMELQTAGAKNKEEVLDHSQLNSIMEEFQKGKKFEAAKPVITHKPIPPPDTDEDEDVELDLDTDYADEE